MANFFKLSALAGPVLTLALGAAAVDWIVFERVDY